MKILVSILTCSNTQKRADACLNTWIKDIESPHDYFFYGDHVQYRSMSKTWDCTPSLGESRMRLPEKTYKMLKQSLSYDWDFLFKCDDDTYVNFERLLGLTKTLNSKDSLYVGSKVFGQGKLDYGSGGAGYLLTRSAVKLCLKSLVDIYNDFSINKSAEDYSVGLALDRQNVKLTQSDLLTSPTIAVKFGRESQQTCIESIISKKFATTHYVSAETMFEIQKNKIDL